MPLFIVLLLVASASTARAQGLGYAVAGPAGYSGFFGTRANSVHAAGGGEFLVAGRAGAAAELGMLNRLIVASVGGVAHLVDLRSAADIVPFVTAGFTQIGIGDGEGSHPAWHAGFGIDYWRAGHHGIRMEFHDHIRPDVRGVVQYWSLRGGIVFRSHD